MLLIPNLKGINWTFSPNMGNTSLRSHLENIHKTEYLQLCNTNGWTMMLPKMRKLVLARGGSEGGGSGGGGGPPRPPFSQSQFLQSLVNFIVSDDQVCNTTLLENCTFNYIISSLSMSWNVVNSTICFSCCQKTCKRRTFHIEQNFRHHMEVVVYHSEVRSRRRCNWPIFGVAYDWTFFQEAAGQIIFTADVWSDSNRRGYFAITCHWIARDKATQSLQFKWAPLAFHCLCGGHDGKSMAEAALHLLDRADITSQVYFIV